MAVKVAKARARCVARRYWETRGWAFCAKRSSLSPDFTIHHPTKPCSAMRPLMRTRFRAMGREQRRRRMKYVVGRRKERPTTRPQRRWMYSIQNIFLNSSRFMLGFSFWNSGDLRYLRNAMSHSETVRGGRIPVTGRHSVMLSL